MAFFQFFAKFIFLLLEYNKFVDIPDFGGTGSLFLLIIGKYEKNEWFNQQ